MRIWVTGIGVVSPLGHGAERTMDRIVAGDRGIGRLTLFHLPGARAEIAAEVQDLRVADVAPGGDPVGWSRADAMSVLAAREALAYAGVDPRRVPVDLLLGGTTAGMFETEGPLAEFSRAHLEAREIGGDPPYPPVQRHQALAPSRGVLSHPLSSTADHVAAALGPFREVRSLCSACSGGANAILLAATWIRAGRSRCAIAGGADALCRLTYAGFGALAALSPEPCRPFDRRRAGLNLGEGAAFLVLEPEDAARARGAMPIVELSGWAVGAEANHITNPESSGGTAARVMREALARAGLVPADIDYVNAHGTATPLNDAMETAALRRCLGREADRIPVSSSKGQIGHTLGAAGAVEAAITAMAIARGVLPPTIGLEEVDPACDLVHVREARRAELRAAMSESFGFGGTDTVLVFAHPHAFSGSRDPRAVWRAAAPATTAAPPARRAVVVTAAATAGPLGVLGVEGSLDYLAGGAPPAPGPIAFDAGPHLDLARARRLDRAARLTTTVIARALADARVSLGDASVADRAGAVVGSAFGSVEGCTAFLRRVYDKGAKLASPADFPNLVPSSPVGHASIYLGLRGPVLSAHDLEASAESAIATAADLIAAGEGDTIAAGSVEEASAIIERCLGPVCSGITDRGPRSEGAAVVLLEAEEAAVRRGARVVARLPWWTSTRGDAPLFARAPAPAPRGAFVFVGRDDARARAALVGSAWAEVPRRSVAPRAGDHEGSGGFAAAAGVAALAAGVAANAMVVGVAPDRAYALLFVREL
jgi:3-oxoacyl-[acyl-carrier-protein] synthase II